MELEGIATFVSEQPEGLELELSMGTSRTRVRVEDDSTASAQGLLNSRIRVRGVCRSAWSSSGRQIMGWLVVPGHESLTIIEASPKIDAGPFLTNPSNENELPMLTTAGQVKRLKRDEALRGYPVRIRGVITCVQPEFQGIVIQDATLGVYVKYNTAEQFKPPSVGEFCEITGNTDAGFAPMVRPQQVTALGPGVLPEPVHPTWDQIMNGSLDTQYAGLEGIVTEASLRAVTLLTREGEINVGLPGLAPGTLKRYENALVRMRGCLFARHEDERIDLQVKLGEVELHNALMSVQEPPPVEPFAVSLKRVGELLFFIPKPVHFSG